MRAIRAGDDLCHQPNGEEALLARLFSGDAFFGGNLRETSVLFCQRHDELVLNYLPLILASLAKSAGFETMFDLVARVGGRRVYLPAAPARFCSQTGVTIPHAAYKPWRLQADANGQIEVPSAWGVYLALRRAAVSYAIAHAWPRDILQVTFGMSRRQLRSYASSSAPDAIHRDHAASGNCPVSTFTEGGAMTLP
ncbi:hypothetical protein [Burkholderia cepacia]|uniref:hypothetical protein n=1 Tax=Burkholderia cepacia TaxID=292 RepID=UPI000754F033|nr:hypothetical protein [Burkholderia cepacia]KUY81403.1 hypothetical protein WI27_11270 [Burkholderia cepacia]